ncbi:MAG: hypothetical protein RL326_1650 [Pseudomonadota bacterium]|jgi:hypothetical protein
MRHAGPIASKIVVLVLLLVAITGCAAKDRAAPITNLFLEDRDTTVVDETLPFNHAWIDTNLPNSYDKVFFRSVTVDKIPGDVWKKSESMVISSREDFQKEAKQLAGYFKEQLNEKVKKYKKGKFTTVTTPVKGGLVFDIAITELEFAHPIAQAGSMLVPVPGTSIALAAVTDPHVAFAARVYDGETGKLIATIADRKYPPARLLDFSKLTFRSPNREICSIWAEIFAEGLNRDEFATVSPRGYFRLLPW